MSPIRYFHSRISDRQITDRTRTPRRPPVSPTVVQLAVRSGRIVVARHRSPSGRGAHRMPPSPGPVLATGAGGSQGGSHRPVDPATRRSMIAVGGAVALAGQLSFSHVSAAS